MFRFLPLAPLGLWALALPALAQPPEPPAPAPEAADVAPPPSAPEPPALPTKTSLPEPPKPQPADAKLAPAEGELSLDDWKRDDWMLVKPQVSLFELDGYFRLRGDLFRRLDFDNGAGIERALTAAGDLEPRYDGTVQGEANYAATNMRLRLEPIVNVTDRIQVLATVDLLDNLVLGSTPNTLPSVAGGNPVNILSDSQDPPRAGINALTDSITVKRAYARLTALNEQLELRFGRMPNHWGLGMMANDGDCLDCDYGDAVDRIALTFRAANHLFSPMFDWVSNGALATPFGRSGGQPIDLFDRDDAVQYSVRIEKVDHPRDIRDRVSRGDFVANYGLWNIIRTQKNELSADFYAPSGDPENYDPAAAATREMREKRKGFLYTVDGYGKLAWRDFELNAEAAFVYGSFHDRVLGGTDPTNLDKTQVYKLGGALEGAWKLPGQRQGSKIQLKFGGASGDPMEGFGALDRADTQRGIIGNRRDDSLDNFQFSPDYHVDLLLFRRILGTVTDAWYVSPGVKYMFDEEVAGRLWLTYSQAIFPRTTPGDSQMLGIEADAELAYGLEANPTAGPFGASLAAGLVFPLGGFDNLLREENDQGGSFAWTIQARLFVLF